MAKLDDLTKIREALNEAESEIHNPGQAAYRGKDILTLIHKARETVKALEVEAHSHEIA